MRSLLVFAAALLFLLQSSGSAHADRTADEINYLLDFVRHSPCVFIRNGSEYDGADAADHVEAKYKHFRSEIRTTEDFIDRAATKSLLSGKPYAVRCGNAAPVDAADWLRAVLRAYREQHAPAGTE